MRIIRQPSKVVSLILDDTEANEAAIDEIVAAYIKQFQQESVLQAVVSWQLASNLSNNARDIFVV